jgi:GMP synthase PP-ATPase subunit
MASQMDDLVQAVYSIVKDQQITAQNLPAILAQIMIQVENAHVSNMTGDLKKQVTISVLKLLVTNSTMTDDEKTMLIQMINTTVPLMIDTIIGVANGSIDISKKMPTRCFCC